MSLVHRNALIGYPSASIREQSEGLYAQQAAELDRIRARIQHKLNADIAEIDGLRLSRIEQLIARHRPDRVVAEVKPRFLKAAVRRFSELFHYRSRRKIQEKIVEREESPYLLAENAIAALQKLRRLDVQVKDHGAIAQDDILLNQRLNGKLSGAKRVVTSISLSYVKDQWDLERICLDGIQNHLPSDSSGTNVWVQCLIDGRWVSADQARNQKHAIKAVRFVDNGVGFDSKNLSVLYSTKADEEGARGQFGEGMKMIAAAALREGLGMVIESQNWCAIPVVEAGNIKNTRKGTVDKIEQLAFDIKYFKQVTSTRGSRTIFTTPTQAFIDEVLKLDSKVLDLRPHDRPLFVSQYGNIVSTDPGRIFVKGIKVTEDKTLFSYNFLNIKTNRDRNAIVGAKVHELVADIVSELSNKSLIKSILQRSVIKRGSSRSRRRDDYVPGNYYENAGYECKDSKYPNLWKKAFEECFGAEACLDTGFKFPAMFDASGITQISMPSSIHKQLLKAGVKRDQDIVPDFHKELLPTSLTLDYGKDAWKEQRMMLDAIQNHLPRDSGGFSLNIEFKTTDGWRSYKEFANFKNGQIEAIKISDDGRGYDYRLLGLFGSTKTDDNSTGKFGEGLKMLSAAAVRAGVQVILRSRDWMAIPRAERQHIDGKIFDQLVFDITTELKDGILEKIQPGLSSECERSSTTFVKPTDSLLEEFRKAHQSVLAIDKHRPLAATTKGAILAVNDGRLFVREILIPGNHNLQYSYHLPYFDIQSRDRNHISDHELRSALKDIWGRIENVPLIRDYLLQAANAAKGKDIPHDFSIEFSPSNQAIWVQTFKATFGPETAFRDVASQDFNAVHANQHMNLKTVTLPTALCTVLESCQGENGERIPSYQDTLVEANRVEVIHDEKLTQSELETLRFLREEVYPIVCPDKGCGEVVAYEPRGKFEAAGLSGVPVKINRSTLAGGRGYAADVYIHEIAHNETGASDADAAFRNFLSHACSQLAITLLKERGALETRPEKSQGQKLITPHQ